MHQDIIAGRQASSHGAVRAQVGKKVSHQAQAATNSDPGEWGIHGSTSRTMLLQECKMDPRP